jgi:hypothetical protein
LTFVIRACNQIGLCSTSEPLAPLLLIQNPASGSVVLSGHDIDAGTFDGVPRRILSNNSTERLQVWFFGFPATSCLQNTPCPPPSPSLDGASRLEYEVCIGTTPYGCQLAPFSPASASSWSAARAELPPLRCGTAYFAVVRATNCARLQRVVASEPAALCYSPPTAGEATLTDASGDPVSFVSNSTSVRVHWSGFVDACAGIRESGSGASPGPLSSSGRGCPPSTAAPQHTATHRSHRTSVTHHRLAPVIGQYYGHMPPVAGCSAVWPGCASAHLTHSTALSLPPMTT